MITPPNVLLLTFRELIQAATRAENGGCWFRNFGFRAAGNDPLGAQSTVSMWTLADDPARSDRRRYRLGREQAAMSFVSTAANGSIMIWQRCGSKGRSRIIHEIQDRAV
jgi:hypothetical protein